MKVILIFCFGFCFSSFVYSQHESHKDHEAAQHTEVHQEHHTKYMLAFTLGATHVPAAFNHGHEEDEVFVPTIGLDFFYHVNHSWSLGAIVDLELSEYIVDFNREELNREKALIFCLMAGYEVLPQLEILAGGGIELEKNQNLAVFRLGTEYDIKLSNDWAIAPSFFYDFKEHYSTWALAIGLSKRF